MTIGYIQPQGNTYSQGSEQRRSEKNVGAAVASLLLPGSAQINRGDTFQGALHLATFMGTGLVFNDLMKEVPKFNLDNLAKDLKQIKSDKSILKLSKLSKNRLTLGIIVPAVAIGNAIIAAVDAYKGKKHTN